MIQLEVFEGPKSVAPEPVRLKLEKRGADVALVAVDNTGKPIWCGTVLTIRSNGQVCRHACLNPTLGLLRDANGRITVEDE
jgi:hypothetical protein